MNKVPHCKECDYFKEVIDNSKWWGKNKHYECKKRVIKDMFGLNINIQAKELKTSPKWCPKRNKR